ncbi:MAG: DUF5060 domain-containing protein [Verrucomicrobia bacterium]|nr:DUF5060 domain-containing protein [Verrucomicrobiota bacterium]
MIASMALAMTSVVVWGAQIWQPAEFTFTSLGTYEKPCVEVALSAVFKGPAGASFRVNGFWDGGASWKVRFTPSTPGEWTYETACNVADAGLAGRKGAFTAQPAAGRNPLRRHGGILRISADHRYLTYLRKCYESVEWWKLSPRPDAVEFPGKLSDATRPLAKSDGDAVHLVWFPKGSGAKVSAVLNLADPTGTGNYMAIWFNPRSGNGTKLAAKLAITTGKCPLPERPDDEDWVLIMRRGE